MDQVSDFPRAFIPYIPQTRSALGPELLIINLCMTREDTRDRLVSRHKGTEEFVDMLLVILKAIVVAIISILFNFRLFMISAKLLKKKRNRQLISLSQRI